MAYKKKQKTSKDGPTHRQKVVAQLIDMIESDGQAPWVKNWSEFSKPPYNPISGTVYKGSNRFFLSLMNSLSSQPDMRFTTSRQAESKGGEIVDYKRGFMIEHMKWELPLSKSVVEKNFDARVLKEWLDSLKEGERKVMNCLIDGRPKQIHVSKKLSKAGKPYLSMTQRLERPIRTMSRVFPLNNTKGLEEKYPLQDNAMTTFDWAEKDEVNLDGMVDHLLKDIGYTINNHVLISPSHSERSKSVNMPNKEQFVDGDSYYSVFFHEYGHALVANKDFTEPTQYVRNRGEDYHRDKDQRAREEILVEMFSVIMAGETGIQPTFENSSTYIKSWLKSVKEDENLFYQASQIASNMAKYAVQQIEVYQRNKHDYNLEALCQQEPSASEPIFSP